MNITESRNRLVGGMYEYVRNIVSKAIAEKKRLIIWGCGKGGAFFRHIIYDIDGRLTVKYYIDEYMVLPLGGEGFEIYRSSLLDYIHTDEYIVLLSIRKDEKAEDILEKHGYIKNENYYDVRGDIGGNYLEYLERTNNDINFSYVTKEDRPDIYSGEYYESKPFDHSAIDRVFEVINTLPCDKTFFDIGCGKGQMLMMASMYDMEKSEALILIQIWLIQLKVICIF